MQLSAARGHVWTAHLFAQSPELWDWVHENGRRMHAGGIWRYGDYLQNSPVLRYPVQPSTQQAAPSARLRAAN